MPYFVYILRSERDGKQYIGCTSDLAERLRRHNRGQVRATKHRAPWRLVHVEKYAEQTEAFLREKFLKSWAGRIELGKLVSADRRGSAPSAGKPESGKPESGKLA